MARGGGGGRLHRWMKARSERAACTPELRVSHIFADLPTTKSFSPVPLFSTRKSCSVTVLMRNTPPKKVFHPPGPRQSISPSLARRWITNFCIGGGEDRMLNACFLSLTLSLFSFFLATRFENSNVRCDALYRGIYYFSFQFFTLTFYA